MKFLADECVDERAARIVCDAGHDVLSAKITLRGASDREILRAAGRMRRILITEDKDFGLLALGQRPPPPGLILIRSHGASVDQIGAQLLQAIAHHEKRLHNLFLVVDGKRYPGTCARPRLIDPVPVGRTIHGLLRRQPRSNFPA